MPEMKPAVLCRQLRLWGRACAEQPGGRVRASERSRNKRFLLSRAKNTSQLPHCGSGRSPLRPDFNGCRIKPPVLPQGPRGHHRTVPAQSLTRGARGGSRVWFPAAVTPSLLRKRTLSDARRTNGYRVYFSEQGGVMEAASETILSGFLTFLNSCKVGQEKWPFSMRSRTSTVLGRGGGWGDLLSAASAVSAG